MVSNRAAYKSIEPTSALGKAVILHADFRRPSPNVCFHPKRSFNQQEIQNKQKEATRASFICLVLPRGFEPLLPP
jgi:hypothetical protein